MALWFKISVLLVLATTAISSQARTSNTMQYGEACLMSDIRILTVQTGKVVTGQTEYRVSIENVCECEQWTVLVACNGLNNSTEPVDPTKIFAGDDGNCTIKPSMPKS